MNHHLTSEEIKVVAANICAAAGLKCDYNIKTLATRKIDNAVIYSAHHDRITAKNKRCIYSRELDTIEDHEEFLNDVRRLVRKLKAFEKID